MLLLQTFCSVAQVNHLCHVATTFGVVAAQEQSITAWARFTEKQRVFRSLEKFEGFLR